MSQAERSIPSVSNPAASLATAGFDELRRDDPELSSVLEAEQRRQESTLLLVAAATYAWPSVLACSGTVPLNVTTEGYPGARFHAGCAEVDRLENLAVERAKSLFGARWANVQPHSGSSANLIVMLRLLEPGDVLLGMDLTAGGHLTHGSKPSVTGRYFQAVGYGVDAEGRIDLDEVASLARAHRPRMLIAGASAYTRQIDFAAFREIADEVGAWLLADVSHISGLIAAGLHPSPVDHAHVTTTSTYKQLCGPRGGLLLMGRDAESPAPKGRGTLATYLDRAVFPHVQGTPDLASVAAKARALAAAKSGAFQAYARRILEGSQALAKALAERGYALVGGGTENHTVLVDLRRSAEPGGPLEGPGLSGAVVEEALERCGIVVNRNRVPGDTSPARVTGGLRLGTNAIALRGMGAEEARECASLIAETLAVIEARGPLQVHLDEDQLDLDVAERIRDRVGLLCQSFPLPGYPAVEAVDV